MEAEEAERLWQEIRKLQRRAEELEKLVERLPVREDFVRVVAAVEAQSREFGQLEESVLEHVLGERQTLHDIGELKERAARLENLRASLRPKREPEAHPPASPAPAPADTALEPVARALEPAARRVLRWIAWVLIGAVAAGVAKALGVPLAPAPEPPASVAPGGPP